MKKKLFYLMLAAAAVFACEEQPENPNNPGAKEEIEVIAETNYDRAAIGAEVVSFEIMANTEWTVSIDAEWCTATPASSEAAGSTDAEVVIKVENNPDSQPRTATVTVEAEGVESSVTFTISQEAKGALVVSALTPAGYIPTNGGSKTFTVTSEVAWTVSSDSQWLTLNPASGNGSAEAVTVTATATANDGAARKAVVTVTAGTETKTVEINQDMLEQAIALQFAPLSEEQAAQVISCKGGQVVLEVEGPTTAAQWNVKVSTPFEEDCTNAEYARSSVMIQVPSSQFAAPGYVTVELFTDGTKTDEIQVKQDSWIMPHSEKGRNIVVDEEAGTVTINPGNGDMVLNDKDEETYPYINSILVFKEEIVMGSVELKIASCTVQGEKAQIGFEDWNCGQLMAYINADNTFFGNLYIQGASWPNLSPVAGPAFDELRSMKLSFGRPEENYGSYEFSANSNKVAGLANYWRSGDVIYKMKPSFGIRQNGGTTVDYTGSIVINRVIVTQE